MYVYNLWSIIIYNHRIWIFAQAITLVIVCLRSPVCKFPSGCQTFPGGFKTPTLPLWKSSRLETTVDLQPWGNLLS